MIPQNNRIKQKKDFEAACRYGKSIFYGKIILKVIKNDLPLTRVGLSVGLKYSPLAVRRNKLKRQLRSVFQRLLPEIGTGFDIIVIIQKGFSENSEMAAGIKESLTKANLINTLSTEGIKKDKP
jgi:ribonuclease P protein component